MPLLIGLIILLVIGLMSASNNASAYTHHQKHVERGKTIDEWEVKYTDKELEGELFRYIADPANYDAVSEEVLKAYSEMPHWKNYPLRLHDNQFPEATTKKQKGINEFVCCENQRVARHIMLANRGKVSHFSYAYKMEYKLEGEEDSCVMARQCELVHWIQKTLEKQNVFLESVYITGSNAGHHVWRGSFSEISAREETIMKSPAEFDYKGRVIKRAEYEPACKFHPYDYPLRPKTYDIPSAYYDKNKHE